MNSIAEKQNVDRWAECTPTNALHIPDIKKAFPEALFVHMIRDGRDVALSLDNQGWIAPFPWDKRRSLLVTGSYWEWIVKRGREHGLEVAPDYVEVHFEDLISEPRD